ncbi:MAG: methyltransferase domain-containing protein [Ornithinimicrobium sp.]
MQERVNTYWTHHAAAYDDYQQRPERRDADEQAWSRIWAAHLPPSPARVLDVGTGSGTMARLMAGMGYDVTGIDLSTGMLDRARAHEARQPERSGTLTLALGDAVDPDFPTDHVDAITNRYLMWTLRQPEVALANWRRVLRPTGVLAVVDSTWFAHGFDTEHGSTFWQAYNDDVTRALPLAAASTIHDTAQLIQDAGFTNVTVTPLTEILELDRQHGVSPGHDLQTQFMITAQNQPLTSAAAR